MRASLSPLSIQDFAITSMDFKIVPPDDPETDVHWYFDRYDIDIDFGLQVGDLIAVFIFAKVNYLEEKAPGYSFSVDAGCFFKFNESVELTKSQKADLEGFSTIYIALNSLRGLISNFTANAPFGRYILPSIDLNDLIAKKRIAIVETQKEKDKETMIKKRVKKSNRKKS